MKTKQVTFGGLNLKIASLNCEQVEEFIEDLPESASPDAANHSTTMTRADAKKSRDRIWHTIMSSLENAGDDTQLSTLKKKLDLEERSALHNAVFEISGLRAAAPVDPGKAVTATNGANTEGQSNVLPFVHGQSVPGSPDPLDPASPTAASTSTTSEVV